MTEVADFRRRIGLTDEQWAVVSAPEGHLVVDAAAGTGKTTTLCGRVLYLQRVIGLAPGSILALTFSRAARSHMTAKMQMLIERVSSGGYVRTYTFHGFAYRVLDYAAKSGIGWLRPGFSVAVGARGEPNPHFLANPSLLDGVRDDLEPDVRTRLYSTVIDLLREGHPEWSDPLVMPEELDDGWLSVPFEHGAVCRVSGAHVRTVWTRYYDLLKGSNTIDYPGMISEAIRLLEEIPDALDAMRHGIRHIAVDEYQDTSMAQAVLLRATAHGGAAVTAVGDIDQAIYTFNGSNPGNMSQFCDDMQGDRFPVLDPMSLGENFRSTSNILACANRILQPSRMARPAKLRASTLASSSVQGYRSANPKVVRVRTHRRANAATFIAQEIRRLISEDGMRPEEIAVLVRKDTEHSPQGSEVRTELQNAGLEAVVHDRDPEREKQIVYLATQVCADDSYLSLDEIRRQLDENRYLYVVPEEMRTDVAAVLGEAAESGAETGFDAHELLADAGAPEASSPDCAGVQIRTVHSAKGLEFRVVFITFLSDREFPSGAHPDLSEERRLLYVAATRAQELLYILGREESGLRDFFSHTGGNHATLVDLDRIEQQDVGNWAVSESLKLQVAEARAGYLASQRRQPDLSPDDDDIAGDHRLLLGRAKSEK